MVDNWFIMHIFFALERHDMCLCDRKSSRKKLIWFLMCMLHMVTDVTCKNWGHWLLPASYFSHLLLQYPMSPPLSVHLYRKQLSTVSCLLPDLKADLVLPQIWPCYQMTAVLDEIRLTALYLVLEISCMSPIAYFHMASNTPTSGINFKVQACMQIIASCRYKSGALTEWNGQLILEISHTKGEAAMHRGSKMHWVRHSI